MITLTLDQALVVRALLKNLGRCDEEVQETIQLMSEVTTTEVDNVYNALEAQIKAGMKIPKPAKSKAKASPKSKRH